VPQKGIQGGQIQKSTLVLSGADGSGMTDVDAITLSGQSLGTSANNVVQLNASAELPLVSGVNITNVNALTLAGQSLGTGANDIVQLNASSQLPIVSGVNVSNVNATLLNGKADTLFALLAGPALTGVPTAPTAAGGTNTTQIATTAFVLGEGGGGTTGIDDNADAVAMTITVNEDIGVGETVPAAQWHQKLSDIGTFTVPTYAPTTIIESNATFAGLAIMGSSTGWSSLVLGSTTAAKAFEIRNDVSGTSPATWFYRAGSRLQFMDGAGVLLFKPLAYEQKERALGDASTTLTNTHMFKEGIITITASVARTLTSATGTNLATVMPNSLNNSTSYTFSIVNDGAGAVTLATNTGVTLKGDMVVAANSSGTFRVLVLTTTTVKIFRVT